MYAAAEAIKKSYPGCEIVFNMVPKVWAHSDIYCQLIPNEDDNQPYYEVVPRIGTFEVSVNGVVSIFIKGYIIYILRIALVQIVREVS